MSDTIDEMNHNKPATLGDLSDAMSDMDRKWAIRFMRVEAKMDERFDQMARQMRDFQMNMVTLFEGMAGRVDHLESLVKGSRKRRPS